MDADWAQHLDQFDEQDGDADPSLGFEWDDGNESELARHHVSPEEAEQVFANEPVWFANRRGRSGSWQVVGPTDAGRLLTLVVIVPVANADVRVITGWDASVGERTRYEKR